MLKLLNLSQLADLGNLTQPWAIDSTNIPDDPDLKMFMMVKGFKNTMVDVPIVLEDLEREYCRLTAQAYPMPEMVFTRSWMLFRVGGSIPVSMRTYSYLRGQLAVISQGIAARYARRQASSEVAFIQVKMFPILANLAKNVIEEAGFAVNRKSLL